MKPTTDDSQMQGRVFALLTDPVTHPHVHRIDTHAASVFLDGDRVLKIKRAVRYPYLDYSTLAKRRAACDEELRINQPLAPQIYRRVVPITQAGDGSLEIGGDGNPVEYAVEMARFDESQTIDHLAEAGLPDPGLVGAIAEAIAASHATAAITPVEPWLASIPSFIKDNTAAFRAAACFSPDAVDDLQNATLAGFQNIRQLLEQRGRLGYVRRCHGDLHLANIVLFNGKPVLFDAIEFDPDIASIDILYDLAFPIMDLLRYSRHAAANTLLNRYFAMTSVEHLDALSTLPLFMSLRAAIRGKVLLARLCQSGCDEEGVMEAAQVYFELACSLIHPPDPTLVAIGGLSGTGKSVLAGALAPDVSPQPGAVVLRSDVVRKQMFAISETDRLPERAYRPEMTERIYKVIGERAARILGQGHSVIVDAVFAQQEQRAAFHRIARKFGVRFEGLFLVTELETRLSRITERSDDASDATPDVAASQEDYDIGKVDWAAVDASGTPEQTLQQGRARLAAGGPES